MRLTIKMGVLRLPFWAAVLVVGNCSPVIIPSQPEHGLLDASMQNASTGMTYLGTFGTKSWYASSEKAEQWVARENCNNFGMRLAVIDTQDELTLLSNLVTEDSYLTDGMFTNKPSSFLWGTGLREINPELAIYQDLSPLRLDKETNMLHPMGMYNTQYHYLCYFSLASKENTNMPENVETIPTKRGTKAKGSNTKGLVFIGRFGSKFYFHDSEAVNHHNARQNCVAMGMQLARFDSPEEVHWVVDATPSPEGEGNIWTDGIVKPGAQSYQWATSGNVLNSNLSVFTPYWGLALNHESKLLWGRGDGWKFPYLCFQTGTH